MEKKDKKKLELKKDTIVNLSEMEKANVMAGEDGVTPATSIFTAVTSIYISVAGNRSWWPMKCDTPPDEVASNGMAPAVGADSEIIMYSGCYISGIEVCG